jgi:FdhD protein
MSADRSEDRPGAATEQMLVAVERDGASDEVAVELPLEIRLNGEPVAVTMRTPGDDFALAAGFLYGEGIVSAAPEVGLTEDMAGNTVEVTAADARPPASRRFYTSSSCGVCGKGALEEVAVHADPIASDIRIERGLLARLPDLMRQPAFARSGGLHATGLFTPEGELLLVREDVGRHNAMDKVIGQCLLDGELPLSERVLCVSGRLAFELVQKAAVAGAPVLVGVGAPTSLAVELARDRGLTLAGFARGESVNVYTHPERAV